VPEAEELTRRLELTPICEQETAEERFVIRTGTETDGSSSVKERVPFTVRLTVEVPVPAEL
jgi:hypothetical protein